MWVLGGGAVLLAVAHLGLTLVWPRLSGEGLNPIINLAWYLADLFLLASLVLRRPVSGWRAWSAVAVGYGLMVWLLWPLVLNMGENLLLLVLSILTYAGLLRRPYLVGYLFLFLFCQRFLAAYLYPSFFLMSLLYTTLPPFVRAWRYERQRFVPLCHLLGLALLVALLLPVVFYTLQSTAQNVHRELRQPDVAGALAVSLRTSGLTTGIVLLFGVPLAYALVRVPYPGRALIDTLVDLPIVVPPPIVGITLLFFAGPRSPLGSWLDARWGLRLLDSEAGIVMAQLFVSSPFLIRAAMIAFAAVDVRYENVARTLGATSFSAFVRISLPLALPGILIGAMLTWFRAMAEFGSLRILANRPLTMPVLAYERFIGYGAVEAQSVGKLVLLMCVCVIAGMWILRAMPVFIRRSMEAQHAAR